MGPSPTYLFGDSTPSDLTIDYIAFIRRAIDFSVDVLQCDHRLDESARHVEQVVEATEVEIERIETMTTEVVRALDKASANLGDSLAARCAARIRRATDDASRAEADIGRADIAAQRARAAQGGAKERELCVRALETLLLRQELPDAVAILEITMQPGKGYEAQLAGQTPWGLDWVLNLEIPRAHALAHPLKVERIVERLEVEAPEEAGWLRKETRLRPQRLDRFHIAEVLVEPGRTTIKLRAGADGTGLGFDLTFEHEPTRVHLVRLREGTAEPDAPYELSTEDVARLQSLHDRLVAMAGELREHPTSLADASIDDVPVAQLERPRVLVERFLASVAPAVHSIAQRSATPTEFVLKRLLSDNRREELFVSKTELRQKLDALPPAMRAMFDALHLADTTPTAAHTAPAVPAPAAKPAKTAQPSKPAAAAQTAAVSKPTSVALSSYSTSSADADIVVEFTGEHAFPPAGDGSDADVTAPIAMLPRLPDTALESADGPTAKPIPERPSQTAFPAQAGPAKPPRPR